MPHRPLPAPIPDAPEPARPPAAERRLRGDARWPDAGPGGPGGPGGPSFRSSFNQTAVPLTIAAVLTLTAASVVVMDGWHRAADAERLTHLEDKLRSSISRRVMDHRHGLQSVRGLVLASESAAGLFAAAAAGPADAEAAHPPPRPPLRTADPVERAFREAVRSLSLHTAFPAAEQVGKLQRSEADGRLHVDFAAGAAEATEGPGGPGGTGVAAAAGTPAGRPGAPSVGLVGTPGVEPALARATGLGHSVFADTPGGMFLLMPIYRGGVTPGVSERASKSRGWVFMRLDPDALFAGLDEEIDGELDFRLTSSTGTVLLDSRARAGGDAAAPAAGLPRRSPLQVAGRQWTLEAAPSASFRARPTGDVWLAGVVGVVLAGLLAVLQHAQVRLAGRAEAIARRMTEDLRTAALTDRLTGLANRPALLHRVQQSLDRARREPGYHHAVLFLDFDRFKIINDSLGHQSGDRLLRAIAERLGRELRDQDVAAAAEGRPSPRPAPGETPSSGGAAARFGGDEFIVALENLARPGDALAVARRLLDRLAEPYDLGGREVVSTASIGVVVGDGSYHWAEEMVRDADTAMYEAKAAGRAAAVLFDREMREKVAHRLQTETDLRGAAGRGELELFYQPIMALTPPGQGPRVHRWEALVRWNHPTRGRLFPDAFIGVAEETGLIQPIGDWVLCAALEQLAAWRERGVPGADAWKVGVNLARQQLRGDSLAEEVRSCLDQHGIDPGSLHLEVTETEVMSDPEAAQSALRAVRAIGVAVDMDDFGTGHSSLSCLDKFPLDVLKIDRSFVADLGGNPRRVAMLSAVARLAEDLDIDIVAEGIETADQLAQVARLRCSHGQGYHFSRPVPADEAAAWATALAEAEAAPAPLRFHGPAGAEDAAEEAARLAA